MNGEERLRRPSIRPDRAQKYAPRHDSGSRRRSRTAIVCAKAAVAGAGTQPVHAAYLEAVAARSLQRAAQIPARQLPILRAAEIEDTGRAPRSPARHWKKLQMPLVQSSLPTHPTPLVQTPAIAPCRRGLVSPQALAVGAPLTTSSRGPVPARRGGASVFAEAARRGRPGAWTAIAVVALTGFYNVTRLGPLERVMESGAGLLLAGKFVLVLAAVTLAAQRDFALVPRLGRALAAGQDPAHALRRIAWLDRLVLLFAVAIVYLGVAVSRA